MSLVMVGSNFNFHSVNLNANTRFLCWWHKPIVRKQLYSKRRRLPDGWQQRSKYPIQVRSLHLYHVHLVLLNSRIEIATVKVAMGYLLGPLARVAL